MSAHSGDIDQDNMVAEKVRTASFVRAISELARQEILERIPADFAYKIKTIHLGVLTAEISPITVVPQSGKTVLACVANLVAFKGHRFLLQACHLLMRRGVPFQCWIIGDGPLRSDLTKMARALGLDDCVRFWSFLPHEQVVEMYRTRQVHLYVQASIRMPGGEDEGIPVSLMEALSYAVPVIATRSGAIDELVEDQVNGLLVPPADPSALADAIQSLMGDPIRRRQMCENGSRKVKEEFNPEIISRELVRAIELAG